MLWQSLIATVNEQARALQRAAFSPIVREAGDLANAVFDRRGRMVAQAVTGTPGHINSLALGAARRSSTSTRPTRSVAGDVLITNDPYKTAGQLLDVTVLVPGVPRRPGHRLLRLDDPPHRRRRLRHRRRRPRRVRGRPVDPDLQADDRPASATPTCGSSSSPTSASPTTWPATCTPRWRRGEVGAQRLLALCDQHGLDDIEELADEIIERSRGRHPGARSASCRPARTAARAMLDLADGSRIDIVCAITVDPDAGEITRRLRRARPAPARTASTSSRTTPTPTRRSRCASVLNPELPNNHGSLAPIKVEAPEGSIVNAVSPQPCTARHVVGMFLPNALLKALAQIKPEQAMAEGSGAVWTMQVSGNHDDGRPFITAMFTYAGGVGARAAKPGLSACSYPTGVAAVPVEVVEASAPIRFLRKALRAGSGGDGRADRRARPDDRVHRRHHAAVAAQRRHVAAWRCRRRASSAARPGAAGSFTVNGEPVTTQARVTLQPGDVVRLDLPGGGGYGDGRAAGRRAMADR